MHPALRAGLYVDVLELQLGSGRGRADHPQILKADALYHWQNEDLGRGRIIEIERPCKCNGVSADSRYLINLLHLIVRQVVAATAACTGIATGVDQWVAVRIG